jgi:phenylpropionate dioxygenase-like ring-hydroxylating dioxygenase large terminal subunit
MQEQTIRLIWDRAQRVVSRREIQRADGVAMPVGRYLDAGRLAREREVLRRWPQVACPQSRLRSPGDWTTVDLLDVPILIVRGEDGALRAFINVCRHRGAAVACGSGAGRRRFVCPYHSWTYDATGALVGRPQEEDFPHAPREQFALVQLPVAARCGIVWVVPSPQPAFDWDAYFGPLADALESTGYRADSICPREGPSRHPANWKLLVEGTLETYHFQYLHKATIAPHFHDDAVQQDAFGMHQRIVLPRKSFADAAARIHGPSLDDLGRHLSIVHFFFPCSFLLWNGNHLSVFVMRPDGVDSSVTDSFLLVTPEHFAAMPDEHWSVNWDRLWQPLNEDYGQGASIQKGLSSGANATLVYGTNEFAAPRFAEDLERCMLADDCGIGTVSGKRVGKA